MKITTPDGLYYLHFFDQGQFEHASNLNGGIVYMPNNSRYDPTTSPIAAQFLSMGYDLSDRPPTLTLEQAIALKQHEVTEAAAAILDAAIEPYHSGERNAWTLKRLAALKFQETGIVDPLLQIEADTRQIPIAALATRIIAKSDEYANLQARIVGLREFHKGAIGRLETAQEVIDYQWSIE